MVFFNFKIVGFLIWVFLQFSHTFSLCSYIVQLHSNLAFSSRNYTVEKMHFSVMLCKCNNSFRHSLHEGKQKFF